jgi:hypothetical protein
MSPLEATVQRMWASYQGDPREFAAVLRRYADKAERAGRLGDVEPFLAALREIDMGAGR